MLKQFKNGNLHLNKKGENLNTYNFYEVFDLLPIGEWYCLGNDCMAITLMYNGGSSYYTFTTYDMNKFKAGKTIILYPISSHLVKNLLEEYEV